MLEVYTTKQGDTWDSISFSIYGDCKYANLLIESNTKYIDVCIFTDGISLAVPSVETKHTASVLPPWKKVK